MQQVSTSMTLFLKVFLPVFWTAFFLAFVFLVSKLDNAYLAGIPIGTFKMGLWIFLVGSLVFFFFTVLRLKRVEMNEEFVFVTNYFKSARYPWHNIEDIQERDFTVFRTIHVTFKQPGVFGKKVTFLGSRRKFNSFIKENPHLFEPFA